MSNTFTFGAGFNPQRFTLLDPVTAREPLACWLDTFKGQPTLNVRRVWRTAEGAFMPTAKGVSIPLNEAAGMLATIGALLAPEVKPGKARRTKVTANNGGGDPQVTTHID